MLICKIDSIDYAEALELQHRLLKKRQANEIEDVFLVLEHPPVITKGTRAKEENVLLPRELLQSRGIAVFETERGGDVTYHGPGQIVGYPILDLRDYGKDIHLFVQNIERITMEYLREDYGIETVLYPEYTGVFVGNDKITAIGFAVRRWYTMHGFALNINTNLEHFRYITPCGITDKGVTSLQRLVGHAVDMDGAKQRVCEKFCEVFEVSDPRYITREELMKI